MRQSKGLCWTACFIVGALGIWASGAATAEERPMFEKLINESQVEFANKYVLDKDAVGGLPSLDHVEAISAVLYSGSLPSTKLRQFDIPKENFKEVMNYFTEARIDSDPNLSLKDVGVLLVTTDEGRTRSIVFFAGWKGPLCFSLKGIRCYSARKPDGKEDAVRDPGGMLLGLLTSIATKGNKTP